MKIIGLDDKEYNWKLNKSKLKEDKSNYHLEARKILKKIFELEIILEEVYLPGTEGLYADFYLPKHKIMIEVQGEQHFRFIPFFHENISAFFNSRRRDRNKIEWCHKNLITLITLNYYDINEWRKQIFDSIRSLK